MAVAKNRALYVCRHCQAMVYLKTTSVIKPPCPYCLQSSYELVNVPVYAHASQAINYMLSTRPGLESGQLQ